jgi:adenosylcobinamide-phosphate synthase
MEEIEFMSGREVEIAVAFLLDLLLGDPSFLPHPVVGMGKIIARGEIWLRRWVSHQKLAGMLLAVVLPGGTYLLSWGILKGAGKLHPFLEAILSTYLIFTCLSLRGLIKEARDVHEALAARDLGRARTELAQIVGRDTQDLNEREVIRGAVESVAENSVDGVLAPLFFAFLGGAPLALAYKAVNTLDSMVGYKNERYLQFGWASARLDDLANYIPARVAGLLMPPSAFFCGMNGKKSWKIRWRDGGLHPSPNSAISEAAMAGALEVQLGGQSYYQGNLSQKPLLGDPVKALEREDILRASRLVMVASFLFLLAGLGISGIVGSSFFP